MRRISGSACIATAVVGVALLTGGSAAAAAHAPNRAAALRVSWGKALEVPGSAVLNAGGQAQIETISCPAAGECSAGGIYTDGSHINQALVVGEHKGRWGKAMEAPGTAVLNLGGQAFITSLSCTSPGNCGAGGAYIDGAAHRQAFVVVQSRGKWGKAMKVPGTAALNLGGFAAIQAVSCAAPGACSAVGSYVDGSARSEAFVVGESKGKWGKAEEVPGTAALNLGGSDLINSVSCTSAGNCSAGGDYMDAAGHRQAFVVSEKYGHWGKAELVPGSPGLNRGGQATILSVSCTSPGNCSAGGFYTPVSHHQEALIVVQKKGTWGRAVEVAGSAKLNVNGHAEITAVSCARSADCSAAGYYQTLSNGQAFVVSQQNGRWGKAEEVPGSGRLNKGGFAQASALSCAAAGSCTVAGFYFDAANHNQAFVATELNGRWGNAIEIPGSGALNKGNGDFVYSVACASAGNCSAGGFYKDGSGHPQAFVVNETARRRR